MFGRRRSSLFTLFRIVMMLIRIVFTIKYLPMILLTAVIIFLVLFFINKNRR